MLDYKIQNCLSKILINFTDIKGFVKVFVSLFAMGVILFLLWLFPLSLFVAPLYSGVTNTVHNIPIYKNIAGKTTVKTVQNSIQDILNKTLVTNFLGVRFYIDNRYFEQVGKIEMLRIGINSLENHLARNRGTGGANKYLVQARADIYADYELLFFTSYDTRLKQASKHIQQYLEQLALDESKPMNQKRAVFIVNSDNLAKTLDKFKQQLQTNIMIKLSFLTRDNKFYTTFTTNSKNYQTRPYGYI